MWSFPAYDMPSYHLAGVLVLSLVKLPLPAETVMAQADEFAEIDDHLAHLFVHGVMHLLGYDHENDMAANEMEALEITILAAFSIANPYRRPCNHGGCHDQEFSW